MQLKLGKYPFSTSFSWELRVCAPWTKSLRLYCTFPTLSLLAHLCRLSTQTCSFGSHSSFGCLCAPFYFLPDKGRQPGNNRKRDRAGGYLQLTHTRSLLRRVNKKLIKIESRQRVKKKEVGVGIKCVSIIYCISLLITADTWQLRIAINATEKS